jgi:hypothetical protein
MKNFQSLRIPTFLAICALVASSVPAHAGGVGTPPAPPISGWLFDEGAGTVSLDPYSWRNGTLEGFTGAPWPTATPFAYPENHYLAFTGTSRVIAHDDAILAWRPSSSVSVWFRLTSAPEDKQYTLYSERDMCDFNIFWVGVEKRAGMLSGVKFAVYDSMSPACGSGFWHELVHPVVPADASWHHVVATLHPGVGMKLYFDGALVGMMPGVGPYMGGVQSYSTIGQAHTAGSPTGWAGSIDEVGLFDHALSPSEVAWLFTHSLKDLPPPVHERLCFGDGSGTACPCGNESTGGGCKHNGNSGATLEANGSGRLSWDTLSFSVLQMPSGTSCLLFQGTSLVAGGDGAVFGDGLRCVAGTIVRLSVHTANDHFDYYPHPGEPPVATKGMVTSAGSERFYQVWYRDASSFCTSSFYNLSNAVRVVWGS